MSTCLGPNHESGNCYGCGKPVCDSKVDSKWYKKGHITINITLKLRPMDGKPQEKINSNYNFTVHGIDCMQKVNWKQVKADIIRIEKELCHVEWKNNIIGIE